MVQSCMSDNTPIPADPLLPSDFIRIEAAALNGLAQRLDGPMLAPFTQAADLRPPQRSPPRAESASSLA